MRIAGLQKLTLLDFPERTAATAFIPGCNFRCPFCHNADLVLGNGARDAAASAPVTAGAAPDISLDEFFAFLDTRHGLLDGVCVTGGEPLLQPDLEDFCARIKQEGFAVKLDTNGSFPDRLRDLVEKGVVDYVAMDIKHTPERYGESVGILPLELASVRASIDFLMSGPLPYEFRTTVVRELHSPDDLASIARWIKRARAWFLQSFVDADSVLAGPSLFHAYEPDELEAFLPQLRRFVPTVQLRGA